MVLAWLKTSLTMCLFNNSSPSPPPIPPVVAPPPVIDNTQDNAASRSARLKQEKAARLAKGRESTISTSPLGVVDQSGTVQAPDQKKSTLLGY